MPGREQAKMEAGRQQKGEQKVKVVAATLDCPPVRVVSVRLRVGMARPNEWLSAGELTREGGSSLLLSRAGDRASLQQIARKRNVDLRETGGGFSDESSGGAARRNERGMRKRRMRIRLSLREWKNRSMLQTDLEEGKRRDCVRREIEFVPFFFITPRALNYGPFCDGPGWR